MKQVVRLLFCIFIFLLYIASANAQSHLRRPIYGDFFAGMTLSSMDIQNGNEFKKHKIGFMLGANVNYKFYHNLQLQSGFYIMKKGLLKHEQTTIDLDGPLEKRDIKRTVDANYIQIPLNIGFEVPLSKELFLNMNAGVYGAYGFKGVTKQEGYKVNIINGVPQSNISQDEADIDTFSSTNLKRWDYGIGGSVGLVYDIFILKIQYDHGLANVATDNLQTDWKTRNYTIILGFRF